MSILRRKGTVMNNNSPYAINPLYVSFSYLKALLPGTLGKNLPAAEELARRNNGVRSIFERATDVNEKEFIKQQVNVSSQQYQQKIKRAKADYAKAMKELSKWENIMLDSIEGTCVFTPEQVKKRMDAVQESADKLKAEIDQFQDLAIQAKATADEIHEQHQRLLSWAKMFDEASLDEKKVIASYVVKAVTVARNYDINVEFNITEAQYLSGMEMS